MKFALITTNLSSGGAEKALLKLASGLSQRGHEVHLLLLEDVMDHQAERNVQMHIVTPHGHRAPKGFMGKWITSIRLRKLYWSLSAPSPFDRVVSTLPFTDEIVHLAKLPRVWYRIANTLSAEIEHLNSFSRKKAARRLKRYQRIYERQNLIAVSAGVAADLRTGLRLQRANITVIYNVFDFDVIRKAGEQRLAELPDQPYVVHVGRFSLQKRHDLLLESWKQTNLPHSLVLLTRQNAELDALIERSGMMDKVFVAGFQTNPYPWIRHADLLVLCSDREGLPNVLIEALILGTPVVSTDCPSGPKEILGDLADISLVSMNDSQALATGILRTLSHPFERPAGFEEKFSRAVVLDLYESLQDNLVLVKCRE